MSPYDTMYHICTLYGTYDMIWIDGTYDIVPKPYMLCQHMVHGTYNMTWESRVASYFFLQNLFDEMQVTNI